MLWAEAYWGKSEACISAPAPNHVQRSGLQCFPVELSLVLSYKSFMAGMQSFAGQSLGSLGMPVLPM